MQISDRSRAVLAVILTVLGLVAPETGWISPAAAQAVTVICIALIAIVLGPVLLRYVSPRVSVSPPPIWADVQKRRTPKQTDPASAGTKTQPEARPVREWKHDGTELLPDDVPPDWAAPFYNGKSINKCPWDDFRTIHGSKLNDHFETHIEPPVRQYDKEVNRVPRQWAKRAVYYLGGIRGPHYGGVPADPDQTLYVTEAYANELVGTGLYGHGPMPQQAHALVAGGPPLKCRCGAEAPNTAWFQTHLHENGIT